MRSDDPQAIAAALRRVLEGNTEAPDPARLREYSYPPIAERMAGAVESAIATRSASRDRTGPYPSRRWRPAQPIGPAGTGDEGEAALDEDLHRFVAPVVGPDDEHRYTDSGIDVKRVYDADDVAPGLDERLGEPGEFPYTRGIHPGMYRDRLWTMRQYAGYATAEETNRRYRYLIEHGSTGLSMAFDLPTQLGRDSDDPLCQGEVGRTGVAIDTIEDMRICFEGIPLDEVSTSMTINAPAAILLLLYELVAEEQGISSEKLRGTVQNDVLKEYVARGNYIYPPEPTMRLTTDIFAYCRENVPKWNTISISGYHIREKGCSAVQEVGFTLSNAIAYVEAALSAGLKVDEFGPRLAFFFNCHNNVFQEVAVPRGAPHVGEDHAGALRGHRRADDEDPLPHPDRRGHAPGPAAGGQHRPGGAAGIRRGVGRDAVAAHNGFDEALALPTERSARIALRTQQVLAHESGVADSVDPFAGSYFIEALTDEIEARAWELMGKVEQLGGSVNALEFIQREIEESALSYHERYRQGQDIIVGVNKYVTEATDDVEVLKVDPESSAASSSGWRRSSRIATRNWSPSASRICARWRARTETCFTRSRTHSATARRSARSAARCATCSASTKGGVLLMRTPRDVLAHRAIDA